MINQSSNHTLPLEIQSVIDDINLEYQKTINDPIYQSDITKYYANQISNYFYWQEKIAPNKKNYIEAIMKNQTSLIKIKKNYDAFFYRIKYELFSNHLIEKYSESYLLEKLIKLIYCDLV